MNGLVACLFAEGGRLERELKYTHAALGEADSSTHQLVIQTPRDPEASLLHPAALLSHLDVVRAATSVTVQLFDMWVACPVALWNDLPFVKERPKLAFEVWTGKDVGIIGRGFSWGTTPSFSQRDLENHEKYEKGTKVRFDACCEWKYYFDIYRANRFAQPVTSETLISDDNKMAPVRWDSEYDILGF